MVTGLASSGTNTYSLYVAKNGSVVTTTKVTSSFGSTANSLGQVTILHAEDISSSDTWEVFVENNDGTTNFVAETVSFRVK